MEFGPLCKALSPKELEPDVGLFPLSLVRNHIEAVNTKKLMVMYSEVKWAEQGHKHRTSKIVF